MYKQAGLRLVSVVAILWGQKCCICSSNKKQHGLKSCDIFQTATGDSCVSQILCVLFCLCSTNISTTVWCAPQGNFSFLILLSVQVKGQIKACKEHLGTVTDSADLDWACRPYLNSNKLNVLIFAQLSYIPTKQCSCSVVDQFGTLCSYLLYNCWEWYQIK